MPAESKTSNSIEKDFIFAVEEPLNDPVRQLTIKYFGTKDMNNRLLPNADSVIADVNGLQILIVNDYFLKLNLNFQIRFLYFFRNVVASAL